MAIHGSEILIYSGTTLIGGQRDVTINTKCEISDAHSKSDYPNKVRIASWSEWDVSFSGVFATDHPSDLEAGTTITVNIKTAGTSGETLYSGSAIVNEFSMTASNDDVATFSCSLTGTGALTVIS